LSPAAGKQAKTPAPPDGPICMIDTLTTAAKRKSAKSSTDKRPVPKCGTVRSYNEGCRGDACVLAMREYRRERAAQDA
jgi:hypothetical protein